MPATKKTASATQAKAASASANPKAGAKKNTSSTAIARQKPTAVVVTQPGDSKKVAPKKAALKQTAASVSVSRTSNPRSETVTIKKITRNIVHFHMTEEVEIRRVTKSDNVSKEKLKAKYASLKAKVKG